MKFLNLGFLACKKKVSQAFPELDPSTIIELDNEGEEEVVEGTIKVRTDAVGIEEVSLDVTTEEEASIAKTTAKVITNTEAMINKSKLLKHINPGSDYIFLSSLLCSSSALILY